MFMSPSSGEHWITKREKKTTSIQKRTLLPCMVSSRPEKCPVVEWNGTFFFFAFNKKCFLFFLSFGDQQSLHSNTWTLSNLSNMADVPEGLSQTLTLVNKKKKKVLCQRSSLFVFFFPLCRVVTPVTHFQPSNLFLTSGERLLFGGHQPS